MKNFTSFLTEESQLTLKYHDKLNPKFWAGMWSGSSLKSAVRKKLLEIGRTWAKWANIPDDAIEDIVFVGGNANYNYTDHSDVDVHVIVDKNKLPDCPDLVDDYFKDKKELWSLTHSIKIYGHDVELYAQDKKMKFPKDQGVYSLLSNRWIIKPRYHEVDLENPHIVKKVKEIKNKIETLISTNANDESFKKLKKKIKNMRASSIEKAGEFAFENLVFKELRNLGVLDKMNDYIRTRQDKKLSL